MSNLEKSIVVSKNTHKELAIMKIEGEYDSFDELIDEEFLEGNNE